MVKLTSRGFEARREIGERTLAKLKQTAEIVKQKIKQRVGTPSPPPSKPLQYPRRKTGKFQRSIKYRVLNTRSRKGIVLFSDDGKARWLEFGTRFMAPRPTFRMALQQFRQDFRLAFRRGKFKTSVR
jgi:hypothetical protein